MIGSEVEEEFILKIDHVGRQGVGIGRHNGMVVFVDNALPHETVKARVSQRKKKYLQAECLKVLETSHDRVKPPCSVYADCGGCQLQHCSYEGQLKIKQAYVRDALMRIGSFGDDCPVLPVIPSPDIWQYRNRAQYHLALNPQSHELQMGFYEKNSHRVVPCDACLLLPEDVNRIASAIFGQLSHDQSDTWTEQIHHIVIRQNQTGQLLVVFVCAKVLPQLFELSKKLQQQWHAVSWYNINPSKHGPIYGEEWGRLAGEEDFAEEICGLKFALQAGSFLQVNHKQMENLYQKVLEFADIGGNKSVLDLYCGVGTISLLLAKAGANVIGVEEYAPAVENAKCNAKLNGLENVIFLAGKAETVLPELVNQGIRPDLIVLDPPRSGCDQKVLDAILDLYADNIIYVSCDPATLARDLKILCQKEYSINQVQPFDLFPQTDHVETVCLMSKKRDY